jgi:hypothetical protein
MNKLMSYLNKLIDIINSLFKLTIIICIIIYLIIYYQSTLNHRYQYHATDPDHVIFDTKKGEMYVLLQGEDKKPAQWVKVSPFSKRESIPFE